MNFDNLHDQYRQAEQAVAIETPGIHRSKEAEMKTKIALFCCFKYLFRDTFCDDGNMSVGQDEYLFHRWLTVWGRLLT